MRIKKNHNDLKKEIEKVIKDFDSKVIERLHAKDKSTIYYVILRKHLKLATIEKINPKNENELIVYFYVNNKPVYEIVSDTDILPKSSYETIKNRNNRINKILR